MTILTSIILIGAIVLVALGIAYNVQKGTKTLEELRANFYDNEAEQQAEIAQELYDKDLRPIVAKKAIEDLHPIVAVKEIKKDKETKSEFPIDKPKKKRKYYPKKKKE